MDKTKKVLYARLISGGYLEIRHGYSKISNGYGQDVES
jgi:hypothetical protein